MRGGKLRHRRSFWGVLVAALLVLIVSGLPTFAAEIFGDGEVACATDCDGSDGQERCPPNCPYGACAKVVQAVPSIPDASIQAPFETREPARLPPENIVVRDCVNEIFHPPRA